MRGGEGTPPSARGGERGGVPGGARVASARYGFDALAGLCDEEESDEEEEA